jgi:NADH-quinone oxidoreductase subunit H
MPEAAQQGLNWIGAHVPAWFWIALVVHGTVLGSVAYLILLERKIASWVQDRIGPNRTGLGFGIIPFLKDFKFNGLGQPLADGLKFIVKEDYRPKGVDAVLFTLAPGVMIFVIIISIAVIPWGGIKGSEATITIPAGQESTVRQQIQATLPPFHEIIGEPRLDTMSTQDMSPSQPVTYSYIQGWAFQIANLNIGVLFVLATLSLAVYGVVIGGWASNNKYSFLGGLRATANMISYEIPLGLAVLCIVLMYGTLDMGQIVEMQAHNWWGFLPAWNCFCQPLAFTLFLICIHAEANRAPFDLAEAEQELVGGYHTEYSSMRFALFFLAEYAGMITTSAVCVALFFGGWDLPIPFIRGGIPGHPAVTDSIIICIIRGGIFFTKTIVIIFVFMWVRWSLPRFRFDQLMMLAWRALIPISLALLMATALVLALTPNRPENLLIDELTAFLLLGANVIVTVASLLISTLLPPAPETNRRVRVTNSRFNRTPLPRPLDSNGAAPAV